MVLHAGPAAVLASMRQIGWGALPVLAMRLGLVGLMGLAWRVLASPAEAGRAGITGFVAARLLRDSASECLPLSQVGGFVVGGRALAIAGTTGTFAAASTVLDVTLELLAQLVYLACGLALLAHVHPHLPLIRSLLVGLVLLGAGLAGFLLVQARGAALVERLARRLPGRARNLAELAAATFGLLARLHAARLRLVLGTALHFAAWIGNGLEAWLILLLMGHALPIGAALAIDSLLYGLRSLAFMVPNALGVQEAGYVLLGGLFGLDMQVAVALSLLRRARDLVLGVPALAVWQAVEGRRFARRAGAR